MYIRTSFTPYAPTLGEAEWLESDLESSSWIPTSVSFWAVALYLTLFLIRPWEVLFPWLADYRFERIYAITMLVIVLLSGFRIRTTRQSGTVLFFTAAVGLSTLLAWDTAAAWDAYYRFLTVTLTYFVIAAVVRSPRDLYFMVIVYMTSMLAYLGKAQWEYFVHNRHRNAQGVRRLEGIESTFGDPNALGMSAVAILPLLYFLYKNRHQISARWSAALQKCLTCGIVTLAVLSVTTIALTNSRASMITLAAFVVLLGMQSRHHRFARRVLVVAVVLGLVWLIVPQVQKDRLRTLWDPEAGPANAQASADGRVAGLRAGIAMVKAFPLTGVGPGNFLQYRVQHVDGVSLIAHNLPGQLLGEIGLVGTLAFVLMVGTTWFNSRRIEELASTFEIAELQPLSGLAIACRQIVILMLIQGLALHNGFRFNWFWIAAFSVAALHFADEMIEQHVTLSQTDGCLSQE